LLGSRGNFEAAELAREWKLPEEMKQELVRYCPPKW